MEKTSAKYSTLDCIAGETNDCVVRAFSIALDKSYAEIHEKCAKHGRKFRECTYLPTQRAVAKEYGMKELAYNDLWNLSPTPYQYPTVTQFIKAHPKGRFYARRNGHAFAIVDGVVHDWVKGTGARSRITYAFEVI